LIGKTGATVVYNPVSNAIFTAVGVAPIPKLVEKGANVALGTDGPFNDMFDVLKTGMALQLATHGSLLSMPADKVFEFATLGGARALGLEEQIGSIEPGKKADLVIIDLKKPNLTPIPWGASSSEMINHIVNFANSTNVDTTIINGKIVMENGVIKTVDEALVLEKAQETSDDLRERVKSIAGMP